MSIIKRILLIGNGAREHVIAETFKKSQKYEVELYVIGSARNPGIAYLAKDYVVGDICDLVFVRETVSKWEAEIAATSPSGIGAEAGAVAKLKIDFAVIGPEAPIAAGVVDVLEELGVMSASPLQTCGRLESSKSFTRDLLEKYEIEGNPRYRAFEEEVGLREFFEELGEDFVVKADGLKGGKGVKVSGDHLHGIEEGLEYAKECLRDAGRVVVEEKLVGQEFSLMSFCDGKDTAEMPAVQDHKRAFVGDQGPNTGGMGSYSDANHSLPFLEAADIEAAAKITKQVAAAMFRETGKFYRGVMYGGFIATKKGVRLIEYNARLGDPEAMNVLALLKTDFVDVCEAIIAQNLCRVDVKFAKLATVCKYVVPEGYPDNSVKNKEIVVNNLSHYEPGRQFELKGLHIYYASVDDDGQKLVLMGSRAVAFVGVAETIEEAERIAQSGVESVEGPVFYREDVGTTELINKRIEMMKQLRQADF